MATITVSNIPDEVHRALCESADRHGHSLEAEVRSILEQAVIPEGARTAGTAHAGPWSADGLTPEEAHQIESQRDRTPAAPMNFDHIAIALNELSDKALEAMLTAQFSTDLDENR